MSDEKILITGGTGLLGATLAAYLKSRGWQVITHSRCSDSDVRFDLCQREDTFRCLDDVEPQVVVNLVALTNVDRCEDERNEAYMQNVRTAENLVEWIGRGRGTKLVHVSTDQVYEGNHCKEHEITLQNVYAMTKYCSEVVASKVGGTVLRTNFFGRSLAAGRTSLSDWVINSLERGLEIKLFSDIHFSPLSLSTLVKMVERVLERPAPGTYNLGSRGGASKAEFGLRLAEALGLSTASVEVVESTTANLSAPRPKDMRMDSGLFERTFAVELPSLDSEIDSLRSEYGTPA